jgi:hypothetical protein
MQVEPILEGRLPKHYWSFLKNDRTVLDRQRRVFGRLYKAFKVMQKSVVWLSNELVEDCASESCIRILAYPHVLRRGPEPVEGEPTTEWYQQAEDALVTLATGRMMLIVLGHIQRKTVIQLPTLEEDAPSSGEEEDKYEQQCDFVAALKKLLLARGKIHTVLVLNVILTLLGAHDEGLRALGESFFRGDQNSQFNHTALLQYVKEIYPQIDWTVEIVRRQIGELKHYAKWLEKREYQRRGLLVFGDHRPKHVTAKTPQTLWGKFKEVGPKS